jgi:N-acetylmuramoyl-L-alanine amidase
MHSFARYSAAAMVLLTSAGVYAQADLKVGTTPAAESSPAAPASSVVPSSRSAANSRYEALIEQEERVSKSTAATAEDFRVVINRYWSFVRRYPTSGFADNALWQAANLSAGAFERFSQDRDKYRAVQLFQWLRDQYPHSPLQARVAAQVEQFETMDATTAPSPATAPGPDPAGAESIIRAVHRDVLPDVVRVTVELDREVPFYQERIDGPARLFFDLKGTKTVASLVDATFRYDSDIVRHIRLGRHPNSTTRVVLDLENVGRYSVFTLYNPYRIVIDAERSAAGTIVPTTPARQLTDGETPGTHSMPSVPSTPAPAARTTSISAPTSQIATADKTANKPNAPSALATRSAPVTPSAPSALIAPNAPNALNAPIGPDTPTVIAGKPLTPSANSSGKFSVARQLGLGVSRIVIDAGHGGHDPGASAFGISEAELVLDVTLRLEKLLEQQDGVEIVLTRRTNEYVSLDERTAIANRESADLFLSVHANASANGMARGVETYFLNFALNPQAEAVAARENAASGKTMSSLPSIIKAITLNSKLNESRDFAGSIQRSLVRGMRPANKTVKDLGVKQAPFMVLIGAAMPSVLAEISFVTNQQEARLLKTPAYRQRIAESLLAGILRYQQSLKRVQTAALE